MMQSWNRSSKRWWFWKEICQWAAKRGIYKGRNTKRSFIKHRGSHTDLCSMQNMESSSTRASNSAILQYFDNQNSMFKTHTNRWFTLYTGAKALIVPWGSYLAVALQLNLSWPHETFVVTGGTAGCMEQHSGKCHGKRHWGTKSLDRKNVLQWSQTAKLVLKKQKYKVRVKTMAISSRPDSGLSSAYFYFFKNRERKREREMPPT